MKFGIVTCTGDRPEAFELCQRWVARFDKADVVWAVVSDGPEPEKFEHCTPDIYFKQYHKPGVNTLGDNFKLGMDAAVAVGAEYILACEDDDYYSENYLDVVRKHLKEGYAVLGFEDICFYNVKQARFKYFSNRTYAPLACTVFHKDLIPYMVKAIDNPWPFKTFDIKFWRMVKKEGFHCGMINRPAAFSHHDNRFGDHFFVGMKGMPGRAGIGKGHRPDQTWKYDPELDKLKDLVGADFDLYKPFIEKIQLDLVAKYL